VLDKSGQSTSEGSAPSKAALDVDRQNGINTDTPVGGPVILWTSSRA
jgi:hypothetical protein